MGQQDSDCATGLYKLQLNCSVDNMTNMGNKCVILKLINSTQNGIQTRLVVYALILHVMYA